jgi:hypothetical protein
VTEKIRLYTIGFTKKSAEEFFTLLKDAGVARVLDVRLNNSSQLAGFTKKEDLEFFLRAVGGIGYAHLPDLAPTQDMLTAYKKEKGTGRCTRRSFWPSCVRGGSRKRLRKHCSTAAACCAARILRNTATAGWWPSISPRSGGMWRSFTLAEVWPGRCRY